jgi:hypothetical protein
MADDRTDLERVLQERAAEIPFPQEAPSAMLVRARRRIARNALTSVVAIGLIVFAGSAGLASLRGPTPGDSGVILPPTTSFSNPACSAGELRATASLQGAAGSVIGSITLTNFGSRTCTLTGRPTIALTSSTGTVVTVGQVATLPQWRVDGAKEPKGWPVVDLHPGGAAEFRVRWSNQCPQLTKPVLWRVGVPEAVGHGADTVEVSGADGTYPPSCNGSAEAATLEIGPFEPSPAG